MAAKPKYYFVKLWRKKNKDKVNEQARRYRAKHRDKVRAIHRRFRENHLEEERLKDKLFQRKRRKENTASYIQTKEKMKLKYHQRVEAKASRPRPKACEICNIEGLVVFDHCHKTNKFRGWLCHRCNRVLGSVYDNRQLLNAMIRYLEG